MIQRIQTIFMALAALAVLAILFITIWKAENTTTSERITLTAFGVLFEKGEESRLEGAWYLSALIGLAFGVIIFSISSFKKRLLQVQLNLGAIVLVLCIMGTYFYLLSGAKGQMTGVWTQAFGIAYYLPIVALVLLYISNRFIKKDEDLVRSADRIR